MWTLGENLLEVPYYLLSIWHWWWSCGGPSVLTLKTAPWSPSSSHLLSHQHVPLHRATRCLYFNKSNPDQLFSFGIFLLQRKFQGLQAESCWQRPGPRASLQSSFHHFSHTVFRTLVCSLLGTRFSWRFSSVISLFTELWPWTSCLYLICTCPHGP